MMFKSLKYAMIIWIRNRNRQRFCKALEEADWRNAVVRGGDTYLLELRKQLVVEPWHKADGTLVAYPNQTVKKTE